MIVISPAAQQAWQDACAALAQEIPHYQRENKPNLSQLAKAAGAAIDNQPSAFPGRLVTIGNIPVVLAGVRERYRRLSIDDPGKYPPVSILDSPDPEPPDAVLGPAETSDWASWPPDAASKLPIARLPEAPASVNFRAFHLATGFQCQFTLRDWDDDQLMARLRKRVLSMIAAGWSGDAPRPAPAVTQPASTGAAPRPAPATGAPPATPSTALQPVAPASPAVPQIFRAVRLGVSLRPDGRVLAQFFGAGRKYADISTVRTPESLAEMLSLAGDWTPAHFTAPATYDVSMTVEWVASEKLNTQHKPYKDIVQILST